MHDVRYIKPIKNHESASMIDASVSPWQEQVSADSAPGAPMKAPTQDVWRALEGKCGLAMVGQSSVSIPFLQNGSKWIKMYRNIFSHVVALFVGCDGISFDGFECFWGVSDML